MKPPGDSFVYEIQLYTSSFMTSVVWLRYHLHVVQVCLIALYMSEKICLQATFLMLFKIQLFWVGHWDEEGEGEWQREKLYLCTCSISTVDHFENCLRSSDRIWQGKDGNCAICFWLRLIFHHLLAFVPALNEISCVGFRAPTSILVIAWEALGEKCIWEHFHMQFPTWELLDYLFLPSMKQVFEQPQRLILTCEIRQVTSSLCFFSNRWNIFNNSWLRYTAGPLFTAEDSGAAQCTPTLSPH